MESKVYDEALRARRAARGLHGEDRLVVVVDLVSDQVRRIRRHWQDVKHPLCASRRILEDAADRSRGQVEIEHRLETSLGAGVRRVGIKAPATQPL